MSYNNVLTDKKLNYLQRKSIYKIHEKIISLSGQNLKSNNLTKRLQTNINFPRNIVHRRHINSHT